MARYIDADTALKIIDNYAKTVTADGMVVVDAIRDIVGVITPTADVVPKSEVVRLEKALANCLPSYCQVMTEKKVMEIGKAYGRQEVAREIFEEMEMILKAGYIPYSTPDGNIVTIESKWWCVNPKDFAELKKRYTEGAE